MEEELIHKFTTHLKNVLTRALCFVVETQQKYILPEHLLWALATQKGSLGFELLKKADLHPSLLKKQLSESTLKIQRKQNPSSAKGSAPILSEEARRMIEKAVLTANTYEHRYVGTEHLLLGILQTMHPPLQSFFSDQHIDTHALQEQLTVVLKSTSKFPELLEGLQQIQETSPSAKNRQSFKKTPALDYFGKDLTDAHIQKQLDPIIGREKELERIMEILCRRTKNNPLLLGEPGVGKTALAEGLAKKIFSGMVPPALIHKRLVCLDLAILLAGTMYRGEFESRLKQIIEEASENPDIILFIDEIHTIVGAGAATGALDAAHILKPALARGEIHCIGATTPIEFKKYIEPDPALERRLQPIWIQEPNEQQTLAILQGLAAAYETYHGVKIMPETLVMAVQMAKRYFPEKHFPDKAIDLMDEAAASLRVHSVSSSSQDLYRNLLCSWKEIKNKKQQAVMEERFPEAMELKQQEAHLEKTLEKLRQAPQEDKQILLPEHICSLVARIKSLPIGNLFVEEQKHLQQLERILQKEIIGQEEVIHTVAQAIRRAKTGITHPHRPLASFLFVGPSGVGKTALAQTISQKALLAEQGLIRFDMSEFGEAFTVSKLLGSPAGYVGYRESAQLADQIKQKPNAVLLFDEIEKAHRDVQNLLLQILEEGVITDATGRTIHFSEHIIILTSNIGRERFSKPSLGFSEKQQNKEDLAKDIQSDLQEILRPELINRLDYICLFQPLTLTHLKQITKKYLQEFAQRLIQQKMTFTYHPSVILYLAKEAQSHPSGARQIRHLVQKHIEALVAEELLKDQKPSSCFVSLQNKKITLSTT